MTGLELCVPLESREPHRGEPVHPRGRRALTACGQSVLGMSDQMKGSPGVSAPGLTLGLDRVQPSQEFRAGGAAARVGSGGDHALCRGIPAPVPPRDERRVGEDGSLEQRVVGLARSLQSTQQCLTRPLRLAQVEELDTPREHPRLGQRRGHRAPGLAAAVSGSSAQPSLAGGSPMMCDRCDRPIDPGDAKPYEVPGATGPGVTVYLCRSAATCCRRSARKRTRTRLAADLPPVPGRRRPGARRARSSSVSWASRSCVPVARLLALAFRWFPRDVAAAERSSFGHSWPLPGALGRAPTAPSEARAPLQEFDRTDVAPGSARTPTPCRIGQGCYSLSSCQRRMSDAPAVECRCGGGPWPCVPSWRADPERQP